MKDESCWSFRRKSLGKGKIAKNEVDLEERLGYYIFSLVLLVSVRLQSTAISKLLEYGFGIVAACPSLLVQEFLSYPSDTVLLKWKIFTCLAVIWLQHGNCQFSSIPIISFCVPACQCNQNILLYLWSHFTYKENFTFFNRNDWSTIPKSIFCVIMHDGIDLSTYLYFFVCFLVLIHKFLTFWIGLLA